MLTPIANADSLRIGSVSFVSPDEINVLLDIEAPNNVALNAGIPRPFPRINSYVLIPSDNGFLVAQIEWITIERSQYPKSKGSQNIDIIDLPYPMRKMSLNPLGLIKDNQSTGNNRQYVFSRGIEVFPTVGDPVLLPTQQQLRAIVESGDNRRVEIGVAPLAANAVVSIDPDRLFGRHLAVLGNTGSGKSCSVAGLIRWSIQAAQAEKLKNRAACQDKNIGEVPDEYRYSSFINSRFIILDPNGEYSKAFAGFDEVRLYSADAEKVGMKSLRVPFWLWNSSEWCAFTQASAGTQRPILRRALREIRLGIQVNQSNEEEVILDFRRYLSAQLIEIRNRIADNSILNSEANKFGFYLAAIKDDLENKEHSMFMPSLAIRSIIDTITPILASSHNTFSRNGENVEYYRAFTSTNIQSIEKRIQSVLESLGGVIYTASNVCEDTPLQFKVTEFVEHVQSIGMAERASQHIDFLVMRIRSLISDSRISKIADDSTVMLDQWLADYIAPSKSNSGAITIIDLSLVPVEIVHIITAVIARMTLEALQRYRKLHNGQTLPTVLVMEEAHTFIKRYSDQKGQGEETTASEMCTKVFEKIAREGRKFGLGLLLSSQRPSELSPTVLSQCNTFLIHRITNDLDQELVKKLVPDNLRGLLRELPSLPSRNAILLGWASELPVQVEMKCLKKEHQPQSSDPDFWNVWTAEERTVNWKEIADDWQSAGQAETAEGSTANPPPESSDDPSEEEDLPF